MDNGKWYKKDNNGNLRNITLIIELSERLAWYFAQFLKRAQRHEILIGCTVSYSEDGNDTLAMREAIRIIEEALAEIGYSPS